MLIEIYLKREYLEVNILLIMMFSILWGLLIPLIFCAPYSYYPLFIIVLLSSIAAYIFSRRFFKKETKYSCFFAILIFILSYSLCSFIIFKPADFHYTDINNNIKDKKAVIFYCEGEMEKYTPYYSNCFFKDKPFILKPFYALEIKRIYKKIGVNTKNKELVETALEVKNSLLNYNPYLFYICFDSYTPDIKDSIYSAIEDGCKSIIIINYSSNQKLYDMVSKRINIASLGIKIEFTAPVYSTNLFSDYMVERITNMNLHFDGILLIDDNTPTAQKIKASLMELGYKNHQIFISENIEECLNIFRANGTSNILYVNLTESGNGINAEVITPKRFEKHSKNMKINGLKAWEYDKRLVKASLEVFLKVENEAFK